MKKYILLVSILVNILLLTYITLKHNQLDEALSSMTFRLQHDLVQLEGAIDYQSNNNWEEGHVVIEKIEDIREGIYNVIVAGEVTKQQEKDLRSFHTYFAKFPDYSGFPNTRLNENETSRLVELGKKLRVAGWGMNMSYSGGWDSFSKSLQALIH